MTSRHSAITHASRMIALRQLALEIGIAEALGALATMDDGTTPRERAAEARQSRRAAMLAEYETQMKLGKGRLAVGLVAKKFAAKGDLVERASLVRNLHRWIAKRISDNVHLRPTESTRK